MEQGTAGSAKRVDPAPRIDGHAEIRGRSRRVTWCDGFLSGDPELRERLLHAATGPMSSPSEFLRALRVIGGSTDHVVLDGPLGAEAAG